MILESLRNLALREGLLENPDYEPKPVAWIIVLNETGNFINLVPTVSAEEGKKPKAKTFSIPRRLGRTSSPVADFLVDKSEYVLGIEPDSKRSEEDLALRLNKFRKPIRDAFQATSEKALTAIDAFLSSDEERQKVIERVNAEGYKSNDLFAFEYQGTLVHELPEIRQYFSLMRRAAIKDGAQCLICGMVAPPVDKHPTVRIPGGTTSGIAMVSFNSDAFESYGWLRNQNAPVCRNCADAYTTALNRLFSMNYPDPEHPGQTLPRRFVRLSSDTTAVYWGDSNPKLLDLFSSYFDTPKVETVGALFESVHKGRESGGDKSPFYCLILSGGQGRAIVRSSHIGTVDQVELNISEYFSSVDIGTEAPLPLMFLLRNLVLQGKLENLAPGLVTDIFMAIVFGGNFPRTLLTSAVGRCRAERKVTRERAAFLRAYLMRNQKLEVSVGLDKENLNTGYRLGRLMAVLERLQTTAIRGVSRTIVDRYYGSASTRPATVFPRLIAMAQHHVAKLKIGLQYYYKGELAQVMDGLASFPQILSLEDQGLFALGYYHQRYNKAEESSETVIDAPEAEEAA